jgi:NADH dehydrogenase
MTQTAATSLPGPPLLICLLGGSGFIGTELAARLARDGHRLRIVTRRFATAAHLRVLPNCEIVVADVHRQDTLGRVLSDVDVVVNLIGILNESGRSGAGFRRAHAELARRVVDAAVARRVTRLLQMSSLGADVNGPSHYLRSKGEAERAVRAAPATLDTTIFRPSVVFGPRDSLTNRFAGLLRLSAGWLPLAKPNARFAPVYVGDVADAFVRALRGGPTSGRTYELCGPDVVTLEQLVRMTAATAGLPCHVVRLPDFIARVQAFVMDFLPGKPFSTDNYRSLSQDSVCRENGCAQLGLTPSSISAVLPTYLGSAARESRLDAARSRVGRRLT